MPVETMLLERWIRSRAGELRRLLSRWKPVRLANFDNRPTWDNSPKFDNRPGWDNWNKR